MNAVDVDRLDAVYRPACSAPHRRLCGVTHVGAVRENNQDALFVGGNVPFFIVADGLGGQPAGEVASGVAVRTSAGVLAETLAR